MFCKCSFLRCLGKSWSSQVRANKVGKVHFHATMSPKIKTKPRILKILQLTKAASRPIFLKNWHLVKEKSVLICLFQNLLKLRTTSPRSPPALVNCNSIPLLCLERSDNSETPPMELCFINFKSCHQWKRNKIQTSKMNSNTAYFLK